MSRLWKLLGDISLLQWLASLVPSLIAGVAGYIRGIETIKLIALTIILLCLCVFLLLVLIARTRPHDGAVMNEIKTNEMSGQSADAPAIRTGIRGEDSNIIINGLRMRNQTVSTDIKRSNLSGSDFDIE